MTQIDIETDKAAIVALLDREFAAFYRKDFAAMEHCWLDSPTTCRWGWSSRGGLIARIGWTAIGTRMRQLMQESPQPSGNVVRRENLDIHVDRDTAWLTFEQYGDDTGNRQMDMPGLCHEMRVLERHDGEWKIVFLLFLNRVQEETGSPLLRVDKTGKVLWCNQSAREMPAGAFGLVITNSRIRATSKEGNLRLQAALQWAASLDQLDGNRSALPVVIEDAEGECAHICWVLAESGLIQISVNDTGISDERSTAAALIYGITPAQLQVMRAILAGHSLVQAAEKLGISINTARTHMRRMFEKVGVRTQASLVRALLSSAAPLRYGEALTLDPLRQSRSSAPRQAIAP
ncbi:MAG: LuxR C-terminal-related transcriptional regulator [Devosia sp.]